MPARVAALRLALPLLVAAAGCGIDPLVDTDLGDAPRCAEVDRWPLVSANAEDELLDAIEDLRRSGATCGGTTLDGEGPVQFDPTLQCAARLHAGDLIRHPSLALGHTGSDDSSTLSRANAAGYEGITRQELLAADFTSAAQLVEAWRGNEAHCRALLTAELDHVGVAQAQTRRGDRLVWVVVTGQERR